MGLKVYGPILSACTARVMACLEEIGVEYEQIHIDFTVGEHKKPPHIFRNPFAQVPALEDGDLMLFESRAIARYLLHKYKGQGTDLLREGDPKEAALVDQWVEVEGHQFNTAVAPIIIQLLIMPFFGAPPDEKLVAEHVEKLAKVLDVYECQLSKSEYLAGDFFSLADLYHLPNLHYLMDTPHKSLVDSRPHVNAWWGRVAARPACKKIAAPMKFLPKKG